VTEKILTYRASYDEVQLLDVNNIRFVDFCKKGFKELENNKKDDIFDKIVLRMLLIVIGGIVVGLTPLISNIAIIMLEYIVGISMVFIGSISMVFLWRNNRNV